MTEGKSPTARDRVQLAPFSSGRAVLVLGGLSALALLVFNAFPMIDQGFSGLFFRSVSCASDKAAELVCGDFPARHSPFLASMRQFLQYLPSAVAAGLAAAYVVRLRMGTPARDASMRPLGIAIAAYLMSVGLLVNGILKAFSGRPRPVQTDLFGGPLPFVPAGEFTNHCASNCSFVSGEAAGAAWLVAAVSLIPARYAALRMPAFIATSAYAVGTSLLRISFGGHYLSDTVIAALATLLVFSLLAGLERRYGGAPNGRLAAERAL